MFPGVAFFLDLHFKDGPRLPVAVIKKGSNILRVLGRTCVCFNDSVLGRSTETNLTLCLKTVSVVLEMLIGSRGVQAVVHTRSALLLILGPSQCPFQSELPWTSC